MKHLFLYLTLLLGASSIVAQDYNKTFDKSELLEDFQQFRKSLEKHHPGLYLFQSKERFKTKMDSIEKKLNSMTKIDFYKAIRKVMVDIKEAHFAMRFSKKKQAAPNKTKRIPLLIKFYHNNKAYVYANGSKDSTIVEGSELLSINGNSIPQITEKIFPYLVTDGNIHSSKFRQISKSFDFFYKLCISQTDSVFNIKLKIKDNIVEKKVKKMNVSDIDKLLTKRYKKIIEERKKHHLYKLSYNKESNTAIFRLNSFSNKVFKKNKTKAKKFFLAVFDTIVNHYQASNLLIDLRDNAGGRINYMRDLLSYINKGSKKEAMFESSSAKRKKTHTSFAKKSKKNHFDGKVYFFVSGYTFSAGVMMTAFGKKLANAKVLGVETGGRHHSTSAGFYKKIILKNTGIKLSIPVIFYKYNVNAPNKDRGITPDYEVNIEKKSVLNLEEKGLKKALLWIAEQ